MDWTLIIKGVIYTYLFLACLALYVHFYIKGRGGNRGKALVKVVIATCGMGIAISAVGYVVLMGLK